MSENKNPDLEILGQKLYLPENRNKLLAFVTVALCISWVLVYGIYKGKDVSVTKQGLVITGDISEGADLKEGFLFSFWTPSDSTFKGLTKDQKEGTHAWQLPLQEGGQNLDSLNLGFPKELRKIGIKGFRRYKVLGQGDTGLKEGWWWTCGVDGKYCEKMLNKFRECYKSHWCQGADWSDVRVEIVGSN